MVMLNQRIKNTFDKRSPGILQTPTKLTYPVRENSPGHGSLNDGQVDWHLNHPNSSQRDPVPPEWLLIVKQCCLFHEGKPTHAPGPVDYGYLVVEGFLTQGKLSWIADALGGAKGSPKPGQCGEAAYHSDDDRYFPTGDVFFLILDETEKDLILTLMILEPVQSANNSYKRMAIVFMALVDLKWLESGKRTTFKLF
jgi:hypothetical protein